MAQTKIISYGGFWTDTSKSHNLYPTMATTLLPFTCCFTKAVLVVGRSAKILFFLFRMMWTWFYQKLRFDKPHPFPFLQFASPLLSSCSFVVMLFQGILGPPFSFVRLTSSKFQFHYLLAQATPKFKTRMSMCSLLNKFTLMLYKSIIILCCPFEFRSC